MLMRALLYPVLPEHRLPAPTFKDRHLLAEQNDLLRLFDIGTDGAQAAFVGRDTRSHEPPIRKETMIKSSLTRDALFQPSRKSNREHDLRDVVGLT